MEPFQVNKINLTKYLFFTGKGGVGKTSTACATAVTLADNGKNILLISTDPASNLQDVFSITLNNKGTIIPDVSHLTVINLDPIQAAAEYREAVLAPYRGKLPEPVIQNMSEQLSGSCTVEIAAFNEFSKFITDETLENSYDHIIFDTAPTGHTLRMLQLPAAWNSFISESTHGASCLGQLSGLESKKAVYKKAVDALASESKTSLLLITRPETAPLKEAARAARELSELGIQNQKLIINGLLTSYDDSISTGLYKKQQSALKQMPSVLLEMPHYSIPLRAYNITGLKNVRALLTEDYANPSSSQLLTDNPLALADIIDDIIKTNKKVIFTMGKGGVGKTTMAAAIAVGLARKNKKVHLATTDPAAHLKFIIDESYGITMSQIDEQAELSKYQREVLAKARETMNESDLAYIEEDLRSPCTQEIAVFRAFAEIINKADEQIVVIDTAPTGHTLLLLDSTVNYNHEIERTNGIIPEAVKKLLPRLRSNETEVLITTLAEATPVFEAMRLEEDLIRAKIKIGWWIINNSLYQTKTTNVLLAAKASNEIEWINKVSTHTNGKFILIAWHPEEIQGKALLKL